MRSYRSASFLSNAFAQPAAALAYDLGRALRDAEASSAILQGTSYAFDLDAYARDGHASIALAAAPVAQIETCFHGIGKPLTEDAKNALFTVQWREHALEVLFSEWRGQNGYPTSIHYVIADDLAIAKDFYQAVCEHNAEVRAEVLVFQNGYWQKSPELYRAIERARLDDLILSGSLVQDIAGDLRRFFSSREIYERYRIPYKRGVLFTGPPGNGKTHAVKALVHELGQPCLYVKSLLSTCDTSHGTLQSIFERARSTAPCLLVLEDIETLVTAENRSFFLNELDGFADNAGLVVIGTTNYAERLDPALAHRPSRFDRTFAFELPRAEERRRYLEHWSSSLAPPVRPDHDVVHHLVEHTSGFSFAYLKELTIAGLLTWIERGERPGTLGDALRGALTSLRAAVAVDAATSDPKDVRAEGLA